MRSIYLFLLFTAFTASAQVSPDKYFPKKLIYSLNVDSCTILKSGREGKAKYDLKVVYDRVNKKMYFDDFYSGMRMEFLYNKDTQLFIQNMSSRKPKIVLMSQDSFIYNSKGQKVRYKSVRFNDKKAKPIVTEYEYRNDTLIKETYKYGSDVFRTVYYTYDAKKRNKEQLIINTQAKTEHFIYSYNVINQLISYVSIGDFNDTLFTYKYIYDMNGRVSETRVYNAMGQLENLYKTTYLQNGLIDFEEEYLLIKNGQLETAVYQKKTFKYAYKKPKK